MVTRLPRLPRLPQPAGRRPPPRKDASPGVGAGAEPQDLGLDRPRRKPLLTVREAAALLQISEASARRWAADGQLAGAVRVRGRWRVKTAALERWLSGEGEILPGGA
jgi:excisionase family DNA binding protein